MSQKDLEKLLGGYATGTLTEEERKALFAAALTDQTLFNALADEQALKDLLDDPGSRRRILEALERAGPSPVQSRLKRALDWFRRPTNLALSGGLASAAVAVIVLALLQVAPRPAVETARKTSSDAQVAKAEPERVRETDPRASAPRPAAQPPAPAAPVAPSKEAQESLAYAPQPASPEAGPAKPEGGATAQTPTGLLPRLERQRTTDRPEREQPMARDLFYAQAEPAQAGRARTGVVAAPLPSSRGSSELLGLRYSILKRGREGVEAEADPAEGFEPSATVKLTVEVNAPGFLYVLKRDPSGTWTVLYPGTAQRESAAGPDPRVESRIRLEFPLTSVGTATNLPARTDAFILYSRQVQPDLNSIIALIIGDPQRDASRAALIEAFIQRARRNAGLQGLLIQKVDGATSAGLKEKAVYVVDPAPEPSSRLFAEVTVSQR